MFVLSSNGDNDQAQEARRGVNRGVNVQEESLEAKVQVQGGRARREHVSHVEAHTIRQTVQRIMVEEEVLIHSGPWLCMFQKG